MLRIAVVSSSYQEAKNFVEFKFKDDLKEVNKVEGKYILKNEDILYLCYSETDRERYNGMLFDAFIVTPMYHSLLDVIIRRQGRDYR